MYAIAVFLLLAMAAEAHAATAPGTWTTFPASGGLSLLMTDGSIIQQTGFASAQWQRINLDANGQYDWSHPVPIASMHDTRGFFASVVMPNGRVFVAGGEYGTGAITAEIYDPVADAWSTVTNTFGKNFSDCTAVALSDGRVLTLPNGPTQGYIYDPASTGWTTTQANAFTFNEATLVRLPGGACFTISPFNYPVTAKYIQATNQWIAAASAPTGAASLSNGGEIGPMALLYDGRVASFGITGLTGFYTPGVNATDLGSWASGPAIPDSTKPQDALAVVMPNGHVLVAGDQGAHTAPTRFYDFDPTTNTFVNVSPSGVGGEPSNSDPFMPLLLPTGQVLVAGLGVYTPTAGGPSNAWRPTISSILDITAGGSGSVTYRLSGTQLNGLTEGACYGDDVQASTNYPLIRLVAASNGNVFYARTFNFSTMDVATGSATVTTDFRLPPLADGSYSLAVVTNGIASNPWPAQIVGNHITSSTLVITTQPTNATVTVGQMATFSIAASGSPTPTYQWQKNGADISGATATDYTTPTTVIGDNGATFRCVVSNGVSSLTSTSATLTVNAAVTPPTVTTPASGPGAVSGTSAGLSVLGGPAGSEASYTYTWSVVSAPTGGAATFSPNSSNAAKNTSMIFNRVGTWQVQVTITNTANGSSIVSGPVTITVNASLTTVQVTGPATIATNGLGQFTAHGQDQFAQTLASQPAFIWTATGGTITSTGAFTAGSTPGGAQVVASSGGKSGQANLTITAGSGSGGAGGSPASQSIYQHRHCGSGSGLAALGLLLGCALRFRMRSASR